MNPKLARMNPEFIIQLHELIEAHHIDRDLSSPAAALADYLDRALMAFRACQTEEPELHTPTVRMLSPFRTDRESRDLRVFAVLMAHVVPGVGRSESQGRADERP